MQVGRLQGAGDLKHLKKPTQEDDPLRIRPQKILLIGVLFISVTGFFALKPGCHSVMKNHSLGITVRRLLVPKNFNRVVF